MVQGYKVAQGLYTFIQGYYYYHIMEKQTDKIIGHDIEIGVCICIYVDGDEDPTLRCGR